MPEPELQVAAPEQRGQFPITVPQVEDDREGVILLGVRHQEVERKALPHARCPEDERVADVVDVQVEGVRDVVGRLEDGQRRLVQVRTDPFAGIRREQEAEIRQIGFQQRQATHVVRAVAGDDTEPGIEQVIALVEQHPVMDGKDLHRFRRLMVQRARIQIVQHERQRRVPKEVAVNLQLGQRVAQLMDGRVRGIVDEHLVGSTLGREVVDERDALVEKVPAA